MELGSIKANHARRNLFGPVDHDHLQQDFQNIMYTCMERAKQRWNFDFLEEIPTEGFLQWEELQSHEVPTFYHTCMIGDVCKPLQSMNRVVTKESKPHHIGSVLEKHMPAQKLTGRKTLAGKKQRQTSLTDYYPPKKQIRMDMRTPVKKLAF
ncbi:Cyclin-dependent kinase inhibitor 1 [Varanus komodoensis]|nr:Cyclin-dependent kinase inhibitor 1 [Varanus komodoensis]